MSLATRCCPEARPAAQPMRSSPLGRSACAGPMTARPPGSCSRLLPGSPALQSSRSGSAHSNTVICQPDPPDGQGWTQRYRTHTKRDNLHQATDPSGRRAKAEIFGDPYPSHADSCITLRDFVNGGWRSDRGSAARREDLPGRAKYPPLWSATPPPVDRLNCVPNWHFCAARLLLGHLAHPGPAPHPRAACASCRPSCAEGTGLLPVSFLAGALRRP